MKITVLANKIQDKLAQNLIVENKTLLKNMFIDMINKNFSNMKKPDKIVIKLVKLSNENYLSLEFWFGNKPITRVQSDKALEIENSFNDLVKNDKNLNLIFAKNFNIAKFGDPIVIDGNSFKLTPIIQIDKRKVRQEL